MVEGENWGKEANFQIINRPEVQEVCIRGKALELVELVDESKGTGVRSDLLHQN